MTFYKVKISTNHDNMTLKFASLSIVKLGTSSLPVKKENNPYTIGVKTHNFENHNSECANDTNYIFKNAEVK